MEILFISKNNSLHTKAIITLSKFEIECLCAVITFINTYYSLMISRNIFLNYIMTFSFIINNFDFKKYTFIK